MKNISLSEEQKKIIKRMRSGEVLSCSKTSGQFWIDNYDLAKNSDCRGLIALGMIAENTGITDNYSIFYALTERGSNEKI